MVWQRVWIIQYMKRWDDDICDKSIDSVWEDEQQALEELKKLRAKEDSYYYIIDDFGIIPKNKLEKPLSESGKEI